MSVHKLKRQSGPVYKAVWRDDAGRQRSKTFSLKRDADAWDAKAKLSKRQGELASLDAGKQTLASFTAEWWELHAVPNLAPKTLELYSSLRDRLLVPRLGDFPLRALTPERIQGFRLALERDGVGSETIRKTLAMLQGILERGVEWGRLSRNPARHVRKPAASRRRTVHALSPVEIERIRGEMQKRGWTRDATLVSVLAYAGLRPGEALALRWRDVGRSLLVEKALSFGEEKQTKTGKSRTVPVIPMLANDLDEWALLVAADADDLVFPTRDNRAWSDSDFRNWRRRRFAVAVASAGHTVPVRPYDLRHSYASLLIAEQTNLVEVARRLGHTVQTLLTVYAHVIDGLDATDRLDVDGAIRAARGSLPGVPRG